MTSFGRLTQELLEVLGPDQGNARITQEVAEVLGPVAGGNARVTQLFVEALVATPSNSRETQLLAEVLGPPDVSARVTQMIVEALGPPAGDARITQLIIEALGAPAIVACVLATPIYFFGNATGLFYEMENMGSEAVPIALADTSVHLMAQSAANPQTLSVDGGWIDWNPANGLVVALSNGKPVRTLWVVTNLVRSGSVPVWASSKRFPPWKQLCVAD